MGEGDLTESEGFQGNLGYSKLPGSKRHDHRELAAPNQYSLQFQIVCFYIYNGAIVSWILLDFPLYTDEFTKNAK